MIRPTYIAYLVTAHTGDREINCLVRIKNNEVRADEMARLLFINEYSVPVGTESDIHVNQVFEPELSMMLTAGVPLITAKETPTQYTESLNFWLQLD